MGETENPEEPTLLTKRKADKQEKEIHPLKSQKLDAEPDQENPNHLNENHALEENYASNKPPLPTEQPNGRGTSAINAEEDDDEEYKSEEEEEESGSEDAEVDRKGKGILIEEDEDSDDEDDDSSDGGNESEGESDLADDPLAEVDLDNILPSRTRRRVVQPGLYIANDIGDNDDDSNDSDA